MNMSVVAVAALSFMLLPAAACCCLLLLPAAASCCLLLLAAPSCSLLFLVTVCCYWLLLAAPVCKLVSVAAFSFRQLLAAAAAAGCCCRWSRTALRAASTTKADWLNPAASDRFWLHLDCLCLLLPALGFILALQGSLLAPFWLHFGRLWGSFL